METLINYLDNMFASFPKTSEIMKLKSDLSNGMEDKYNELKTSGKNENEAIAIVISEFGNIEELVQELNINHSLKELQADHSDAIAITMQDIEIMLANKKKYGGYIALGVWLCIMGVATFLLLTGIVSTKFSTMSTFDFSSNRESFFNALCFVPLFLFISIAVALFIYASSKLEKYDVLLRNKFFLDYGVENQVMTSKENYASKYTLNIVIGVILCILATLLFLLLGSFGSATIYEDFFSGIGLFMLLFIIAFAVVLFIRSGYIKDTYIALLQEEEYSPKYKKDNKIVSVAAAIVWPVTTAVYLIWSFSTGDWHITWLIWAVVGILFGAFSAVCDILTKNN